MSLLACCCAFFASVTAFADAIAPSTSSGVLGIAAVGLILIIGLIGIAFIGAAVALFFIIRYFVKKNKNSDGAETK